MSMEGTNGDETRNYTVVLSEPAEAERDAAFLRLNGLVRPEYAGLWYAGFNLALSSLLLFPGPLSHAIDEEASALYRREVRRMLYFGPGKARSGRLPYRILYTLFEPANTAEDGETIIRILRVLHGAQQL